MNQYFLNRNRSTTEVEKYPFGKEVESIRQDLDSEVESHFRLKSRLSLNNFPLCVFKPGKCFKWWIPVEEEEPEDNDKGDIVSPLLNDMLSLTFENIYQNLASKNHDTEIVEKRLYKRTIYLNKGKKILIVTDMKNKGNIVSKISGDTGFKYTLVKKTKYVRNSLIKVRYTVEK